MDSPIIIEFGWHTPPGIQKQTIKNYLTQQIINKHILLIDCYPQWYSIAGDFDMKFEVVNGLGKNYLVADIPIVTDEIVEKINSECDFHLNLHMLLFYNFSGSEIIVDHVNRAIEYCESFDFDTPVKFKGGNIFFLTNDGNTLVIG